MRRRLPGKVRLETIASTLMVAAALVVVVAPPAFATSTPPAWAYAHYESSSAQADYYSQGCTLGNGVDSGSKPVDSLSILDFGEPKAVGGSWGASLFTGTNSTTTTIRQLAQQFSLGFYNCVHNSSATAKIAIGTSNDNIDSWSNVDLTSHGNAWGVMINNANTWAQSQGISGSASFAGASDMELGYANAAKTTTWVNGFGQGVNLWNPFNYGDAVQCATSCSGIGTWAKSDVWYISWGSGFSNAAPEFYHTDATATIGTP